MLTATFIEANYKLVIAGLKKRNFSDPEKKIDEVRILYKEKNKIQKNLDDAKHELKKLSKEIGNLYKQKNIEEASKTQTKTLEIKPRIKILENSFVDKEKNLTDLLETIPNIPYEEVKEGKDASDNECIYQIGNLPEKLPTDTPHWDLIEKYDIVDFHIGRKVTGAGFPFYKKEGATLQRALVNFFLSKATENGYIEISTPLMVNENSAYGTGQLPDKEGQMYHIKEENYYLIPTSEVALVNMYRDTILPLDVLPIKQVAYSPCFRREAGSWGSQVRGLNRLHQFDKVEIVQITEEKTSYQTLEEMCNYVESLLKELELPYKKLRLCGKDMGFSAAMTFDYETYSSGQEKWLEVSSVSNCEQFQSQRANMRYRTKTGNISHPHTLNGSALALPRILACILENNQKKDHIEIPKVLQKFCGFKTIKNFL